VFENISYILAMPDLPIPASNNTAILYLCPGAS